MSVIERRRIAPHSHTLRRSTSLGERRPRRLPRERADEHGAEREHDGVEEEGQRRVRVRHQQRADEERARAADKADSGARANGFASRLGREQLDGERLERRPHDLRRAVVRSYDRQQRAAAAVGRREVEAEGGGARDRKGRDEEPSSADAVDDERAKRAAERLGGVLRAGARRISLGR